MKKVLLLLMITCISCPMLFAQLGVGQQMQNNDFESWTTEGGSNYHVPTYWHSICTATGSGASYASDEGFVSSSTDVRPGSSGNKSVKLKAVKKTVLFISKLANGSLTSGRFNAIASTNVSVTGNCTYTSNVSGYNQVLTAYPDSVYIWVSSHNNSTSSQSHISIKVHGGGVASNNVIYQDPDPSGTGSSASAGGMNADQNQAKQVAYAQHDFNTNGAWVQKKIPFVYTNNSATPAYILATFSTNVEPGGGKEGDYLLIDDVVLIYNTRLASLKVNGADLAGFNPDVTTYTYPTPVVCGAAFPTVTATAKSAHATATISHQPTIAEPYTTIKVTHLNQENDEDVTKYYTINYTLQGPTITFLNSSDNTYTACEGDEITVTAAGASSYTWSNGLGSGATVHPTTSGNYTVTGTDANGCQGTAIAYVNINPAPDFQINGTTAICSGASTTLTASNNALSYSWSTGGNTTSITVNAAGTYTVTGTNNNGCSAEKSVVVTANEAPTVTISGNNFICGSTPTTLTASSNLPNTTFVWNNDTQGATLDINAGGPYSVTGTSENGCTATANINVTAKEQPTVSISGKSQICSDETVTLTASSNLPNTTFTWNNGTQGATLEINAGGTYTVEANHDGCTNTATHTVVTSQIPDAPQAADASRCGTGEIALSVTPVEGMTYNWYASANSQNVLSTEATYTPSVNITTTYYVSAQNADGCQSERTAVTATVIALPAAPTVSNTNVCGESDVTLSATSAFTMKWFSDEQGNSEIESTQHVESTTTYYVAAIDGTCRSALVPMTLTVNPVPATPAVQTPEPICSNDNVNVTLTAAPGNGGDIVRWYQQDATSYTAQGNTYQAKNIASSTTYYATTFNNTTHCESEKIAVEVVKNSIPDAPTVACEPLCGEGTAMMTGTASNSIRWYSSNDELLHTGNSYSQAVTATTSFKASSYNETTGCESEKVNVTAFVYPTYNNTDTKTACGEYTWNGTTYTESGTYTKTLTSVNGCDSIVTLNLTINNGFNITKDTTVCDQFVWQGETYTTSQSVTKNLTSTSGCDSVVTYNVTVNKSSQSAQTLTLCANQLPYSYAGQTIESAGTKTITLENTAGCDSVITLTVVVNPQPAAPSLTTANTKRCGPGPMTINVAAGTNGNACRWYDSQDSETPFQTGNSYQKNFEESTTYYVSSYNTNTGCESDRIEIAVEINPVPEAPQVANVERCGAGEVTLSATFGADATTCRWYQNNTTQTALSEGAEYTRNVVNTSTYYVESYNATTGCKSSRIAAIATVNPVPAAPQVTAQSNCGTLEADLSDFVTSNATALRWYDENEELINDQKSYNTTVETTTSYLVSGYEPQTNCEGPKATLTITINPVYQPQVIRDTICQYAQYSNYGIDQTMDEVGEKTFVINESSQNGCDSLVTLAVYVKPQATKTIAETACDNFVWNNQTYSESGVYTQTFVSANGCDSIVTLNLTINNSVATEETKQACGSYTWNEETYTQSGDYQKVFTAKNGCDSVVTLHLTINQPAASVKDVVICENDLPYVYNGTTFDETTADFTTQDFVLETVNGCDSVVTLNLTINRNSVVEFSDEVCAGSAYSNHGFDTLIANAGTYTLVHSNKNMYGCDSTTTLILKVNQVYETPVEASICFNGTYDFFGQNITTAGDYQHTLQSVSGCDSVINLHLTVYSEKRDTISADICKGESYTEQGFNVTNAEESGYYSIISEDVNGCDSTTVLRLNVHEPAVTELTATLCEGASYTENGFAVTGSEVGTFEYTQDNLKTVWGCDSTVILTVTVNPVDDVEFSDEVCAGVAYSNHGFDTTIVNAGTYTLVHSNKNMYGCDSTTTLTLKVNPVYETQVNAAICFNETYDFFGESKTVAGEYEHTLESVSGCDSVIKLHLTVYPEKRDTISADICKGESYTEQGFNVTNAEESGYYSIISEDVNGCDSTTVLCLNVHEPAVTELSATLCEGSSYTENGFDVTGTEVGEFTYTKENLKTVWGCDSTVILTVTVNPVNDVEFSDEVCAGSAYSNHGFDTLITNAGTYTLVHKNQNIHGCDSTTTLTLKVNPVYTMNISRMICENGSYSFNGQTLTEPGTYTGNFKTVTGCDSIVNLTLTVGAEYRDTIVAHVCEGSSYNMNGFNVQNITESQTLVNQGQATNGCDSITVLQIFVHQPQTKDLYTTLCLGESYTDNGFNYKATSAGEFTSIRDISTVYGCDSTVVLHVVVNPTNDVKLSDEICAGNAYSNHGFDTTIVNAGIYTMIHNNKNVYGCDSVTTLTLKVNPVYETQVNAAICFNETYNFLGQDITKAGDYEHTLQSVSGCDSVIKLHLTVYPEKNGTISDYVCKGQSYTENGFNIETPEQSGVFSIVTKDANGCDSTTVLNLTVVEPVETNLETTLCVGESYTENGFNVNAVEAGIFNYTLETVSHLGCDSIVNLTVTVNPVSNVVFEDEVCVGTAYNNYGFETTIMDAGTYTLVHNDKNMYGCDSTTTLTLTVNPVYETELQAAICYNETYNFFGVELNESGDYNETLQSVSGCDSIVRLHLTVYPEKRDTISAYVCYGQSYTENGFNIDAPEETAYYSVVNSDVNGCDSTTVLHLTVVKPVETVFAASVCQGGNYSGNGFDVAAEEAGSFTYTRTEVSYLGCDSIVKLNLTVNPVYNQHFEINTCQSAEPYHYAPSNIDFNVSAVGSRDTVLSYKTVNGCDSIVTLTVNVLQKYEIEQNVALCSNSDELPYEFAGQQISEAGTYVHTFTAVIGCDSVVTLNLTINDVKATTVDAAICLGETYSENGFNITPDEVGTKTYTKVEQCVATGCDSTVTLNLTVNPVYSFTYNEEICAGEAYSGHGFDTIAYIAGEYTLVHAYQTVSGCDSILTLNLTVNPKSDLHYDVVLCQGEALNIHGFDTLITEPGTYTLVHNNLNIHGCDSVTTINLTINPTFSKDTVVNVCDVDVPFFWNNDEFYSYSESGDYEIIFKTVNNCDSIINLHLNVNPSYYRDTVVTVCQGAMPYTFADGYEYAQGGEYTVNLQSVAGCDSVWSLQLIVTPNIEFETSMTICDNEIPYTYLGQTFTQAGVYDIEEQDADNCTTITHFTLYVNSTYHGTDMVTVCEEELPFVYGGSTFNEAGVYDVHFNSVAACDSVVTLTLNVIPTAHGEYAMTVCEDEFPVEYAGQTYNEEGVYEVVFERENACDSIVTFTLTKALKYMFTEQQEVCEHELPFSWRNKSLNASGVYYDSLFTVNGCDSVYMLQLTVNPTQIITYNDILLCEGETMTWRGKELSQAGTYYDTTFASTGCYVIYKVDVMVSPSYNFSENVTICSDELPYSWRGMSITAAGVYEDRLQTVVTGCDSAYVLTLTVNPSYHANETESVCDNELPFTWHGQTLTESGVYYDTLATVNGCDSTFALTFTVNPSNHTVLNDTVCDSELPYEWRGHEITASGSYFDTVPNTFGCSDLFELNLTVNESSLVTLYDTICQGGYYTGNGFDTLASQAGNMFMQHHLQNAAGCDSTVNVMLSVMPTYEFVTDESTCENVPFSWRGGEYITAGTYYDSLTTQYGCDSVYVLNLSLNPVYDIYVNDTALRHHEYTFGDNFVITPVDSGNFSYDIQYYTIANCDSIVHLSLYVAFNYGIDDVVLPEFSFYPNPTSAVLNIRGEQMRTVEVFSMNGRLIYRADAETPENTRIDVVNYPAGTYLVKVILEDNRVVNGKIIIQRR